MEFEHEANIGVGIFHVLAKEGGYKRIGTYIEWSCLYGGAYYYCLVAYKTEWQAYFKFPAADGGSKVEIANVPWPEYITFIAAHIQQDIYRKIENISNIIVGVDTESCRQSHPEFFNVLLPYKQCIADQPVGIGGQGFVVPYIKCLDDVLFDL